MFTQDQLEELLEIIDSNQLVALGQELGPEFLSAYDRKVLTKYGIDWESLYTPETDSIFTSFNFGMLAESLKAKDVSSFTYQDIKEYIKQGNYIPLTAGEKAAINSIKAQSFNDLKSLNSRIFKDVNQIGLNNLKDQRSFLAKETKQGIINKDTSKKIANEIATKTGDWSRDFDRIITYATTNAYETGKAAMIVRQSDEADPWVYKTVYEGACKHCIRLYLTNGLGSKPRLFRLSELINNGSNIGRKVEDWKATLGPIHPYCRCTLHYLPKGYIWDEEKKIFRAPDRKEIIEGPKAKRKPIRITVGGKEYQV